MKKVSFSDPHQSLIASLELNRCAYELSLLGAVPGAQIVHKPELTYVATGLYDAALNRVCRTQSDDAHIAGEIEAVMSYFKQDEVPFSWLIGPSARPLKLDKALKHYGLLHDYDELGLIADLSQFEQQYDGLEVRRCVSSDEIADFCYVQRMLRDSQANHALWTSMAHQDVTERRIVQWYVGYQAQEPVVAGMLAPYAGMMGLYGVGSLVEQCSDGALILSFVQSMLFFAKEQGYEVVATSVEHARRMVYQAAGFKPLCVYQIWSMQDYRQQYEFVR